MATETPPLAGGRSSRPLRKKRLRPADALFLGGVLGAVLIALGVLAWLLGSILTSGLPALDWDFLTDPTSTNAETAGFNSSIRVTFVLMVITFVVAIPVGFAAALYLEKFAAISREQLQARRACASARLRDLRAAGVGGRASPWPRLASAGERVWARVGPPITPDRRGQHLQPRGGALDHLRPARPGRLRQRHGPAEDPAGRRR